MPRRDLTRDQRVEGIDMMMKDVKQIEKHQGVPILAGIQSQCRLPITAQRLGKVADPAQQRPEHLPPWSVLRQAAKLAIKDFPIRRKRVCEPDAGDPRQKRFLLCIQSRHDEKYIQLMHSFNT